MYSRRIRYTAGAVLAATAVMAGSAGPLAQAAPEVVAPEAPATDTGLTASVDAAVLDMAPRSLADMAQHALDAGVAGAAGALATKAVGFRNKAASSTGARTTSPGVADAQFDAPIS